ncbi:30S ribosomal protein S9 [archaeon]|nr:30S ribosomal protein S9 [archaeon]|tara:strand:+ start:2581 stop:3000 length:420 start_codon:yes stop_codon:yes gene_type:complete
MASKNVNKSIVVSGKRKRSIARAVIKEGKGQIRINHIILDKYGNKLSRLRIMEPLIIAGDSLAKKVKIDVNVIGGGWQGQTEASRLAIARALIAYSKDKKLEKDFIEYDRNLLVADVRRNEPSKPNDSKPRAKRTKSYR